MRMGTRRAPAAACIRPTTCSADDPEVQTEEPALSKAQTLHDMQRFAGSLHGAQALCINPTSVRRSAQTLTSAHALSVTPCTQSRRARACTRRASNAAPPGARRRAATLQYSRGTCASISASRSATSRSATDCTRPARPVAAPDCGRGAGAQARRGIGRDAPCPCSPCDRGARSKRRCAPLL